MRIGCVVSLGWALHVVEMSSHFVFAAVHTIHVVETRRIGGEKYQIMEKKEKRDLKTYVGNKEEKKRREKKRIKKTRSKLVNSDKACADRGREDNL